jgi:hypothetical protein
VSLLQPCPCNCPVAGKHNPHTLQCSVSERCCGTALSLCALPLHPCRRFWVNFSDWGTLDSINQLSGSIAYFFGLVLWSASLSWVRRNLFEVVGGWVGGRMCISQSRHTGSMLLRRCPSFVSLPACQPLHTVHMYRTCTAGLLPLPHHLLPGLYFLWLHALLLRLVPVPAR